jgi:hypothetical protein
MVLFLIFKIGDFFLIKGLKMEPFLQKKALSGADLKKTAGKCAVF